MGILRKNWTPVEVDKEVEKRYEELYNTALQAFKERKPGNKGMPSHKKMHKLAVEQITKERLDKKNAAKGKKKTVAAKET